MKITATAVDPVGRPDPDHTYVVDPDSLATFLKTSEFEVEYYPDLSIKSINAKADDRTAEAIGSVAKGIAGIAKIALAGAGIFGTDEDACTPKVADAVKAVNAQKTVVESALAAHKTAQANFDRAKAKIDATGGAADAALRKEFSDAYRVFQVATDSLASAKKSLENLSEAVTLTRTFMWPERGGEFTKSIKFDSVLEAETFGVWLTRSPGSWDSQGQYDIDLAIVPAAVSDLVARREFPSADGKSPVVTLGSPQLDAAQLAGGIPFRAPVSATLSMKLPRSRNDQNQIAPSNLFEKNYQLRQLGRVFTLPCRSAPLTKIGCSLTFDDKGRVTKAGKVNAKAQGEAAAGIFEGLVAQADLIATADRARAERIAGAEKKEKEERLAILELDRKIRDTEKALAASPPPTNRQQLEDLILDYETERRLLEARRKLEEERALVQGEG